MREGIERREEVGEEVDEEEEEIEEGGEEGGKEEKEQEGGKGGNSWWGQRVEKETKSFFSFFPFLFRFSPSFFLPPFPFFSLSSVSLLFLWRNFHIY